MNDDNSRIFTGGLGDPEGPVLLPDGRWAVVEMSPETGSVTLISSDGRSKQILAKTGRPNGLTVDAKGTLWIANSVPPSLMRLDASGNTETVTSGSESMPFLWPNDLCFGPDGAIYMTDSGVNHGPWQKVDPGQRLEADLDGRVFRIDPEGGSIELIDRGFRFTNGIAFGPGNKLYVNEMLTGNIYFYDWKDGRIVGNRQLFGNVQDAEPEGNLGQPDGMAFGANGCLYVAVHSRGDVVVLDTGGSVVKRIVTQWPRMTNLAFGPDGDKRIYATTATEERVGHLCIYEVDTDGYPLFK